MPTPYIPNEKKRMLGNLGKRPLPEPVVELQGVSAVPTVPESLGEAGTEVLERLWRYASAWLSPTTDLEVIVRYCQALDERKMYREVLERDGYFSTGSKGQPVIHPAQKALREIDAQLLRYENVLGLTPADRSRLGYAEIKKASKLQELLSAKEAT